MSGVIARSDRHFSDSRNIEFDSSYWISELIDNIGHDHFFPWIASQLRNVVPHEFCVIFLYRTGQAPSVLHDGLTPLGHREGIINFVQNTYAINPFYTASQNGLAAGLHRLGNFNAPSSAPPSKGDINGENYKILPDQSEEIGYLTQGWPQGMQELILAVPLDQDEVVEISISQRLQASTEGAPLFDRSQQLVPILISSIRKHCEMLQGGPASVTIKSIVQLDTQSDNQLINQSNTQFGTRDLYETSQFGVLTDRERSVMELVLAGHSSESIGLCLKIALPTVKTHRRNIYRKLGISSQAELFSLVMHKTLH